MGLNNGGYTFLHPASIPAVTDADIQEIFTNKARFLMRVLSTDGRQRVSVLKQIADFKSVIDKHIKIIFSAQATSRSANTQGVCVNGEDVTFKSLNRDGNSYFVLSPNFGETKVSETKASYGICGKFFTLSFVNPSGRMMPVDYFMSAEIHFGGGGCFSVISQNTTGDTVAINIGFR
ncbi:hypothetical protein CAPTEDRAFT_205066 [Capitella teleta]|nr:hypothetical protein CAPTEDRAFT_205066 [Capitella teleta]|eukprot:ELT90284.1 hypothetical protein CAPTEDRAFT_205066 [Capitella teleta]